MTPMRHGGCWAGVGARGIYTRRSCQALRHGPTDVARLGCSLQCRRRCWVVRSHLSGSPHCGAGSGSSKAGSQCLSTYKGQLQESRHGTPSKGCSTTTILAQLSIEPDAGAGAVHIITLYRGGFVGIGNRLRLDLPSMPNRANLTVQFLVIRQTGQTVGGTGRGDRNGGR
jgi:hypothetical protein